MGLVSEEYIVTWNLSQRNAWRNDVVKMEKCSNLKWWGWVIACYNHVTTKIRFWRTVHWCCHHPSRCTLISGRIFVEQNVWQNSKMSIEQSTNIIPIIPLISIRKPESEEEEELVVCIIYIYTCKQQNYCKGRQIP